MGFIYGAINTSDKPVEKLTTSELLGDTVRVSNAMNIGLYALADDKEPNRNAIASFGPVASKGDLAELVTEVRYRAAKGDTEVKGFLDGVEAAYKARTSPDTKPRDRLGVLDDVTKFALVIPTAGDPVIQQHAPRADTRQKPPVPEYYHS